MSDRTGQMEEGFKNKPNKGKRKSARDTSGFPWVLSPAGRTMKILIGFVGDKMVHSTNLIVTRDFKGNGITGSRLMAGLLHICPWASDHYQKVRGALLDEEIVYHRFHKMYYRNGKPGKGGKPEMSPEHYSVSPRLRIYVPKVREIWVSGEPITLEDAERLGALN